MSQAASPPYERGIADAKALLAAPPYARGTREHVSWVKGVCNAALKALAETKPRSGTSSADLFRRPA